MTSPTDSPNMRYLAAALMYDGDLRDKIIRMFEEEHRALAPEFDLDITRLAMLSYALRSRERTINLIYLAIFVLACVAALFGIGFAVITLVLAGAIAYFVEHHELTYHLKPHLREESYDLEAFERRLQDHNQGNALPRQVSIDAQNLLIYRGFNPFVGAGAPLGGWSFAVSIDKPKAELGQSKEMIPFSMREIWEAAQTSLENCGFLHARFRNMLVVSGKAIRNKEWILPSIYDMPVDHASAEQLDAFYDSNDPGLRLYKWIGVSDEGRQILFSYFLRLTRSGNQLYVEAVRFLLTPIMQKYRAIDEVAQPGDWGKATLVLTSLVLGPLVAILGVFTGGLTILDWLSERDLFGRRARKQIKEIERNVRYDFGAGASLREQVSSETYDHFFQMLDKERYAKILDKEILASIASFLDAHNIDTSDIKERQTTVLNNGVIVQGGEVRAEALAVGSGAQSSVRGG